MKANQRSGQTDGPLGKSPGQAGAANAEPGATCSFQSSMTFASPDLLLSDHIDTPDTSQAAFELLSPTASQAETLLAEIDTIEGALEAAAAESLTPAFVNALILQAQTSDVAPWFEEMLRTCSLGWGEFQASMDIDAASSGTGKILLTACSQCSNQTTQVQPIKFLQQNGQMVLADNCIKQT